MSSQWKTFGKELRKARQLSGFTLTQVASHMVVSASLISKCENGDRATQRKIAESLDHLYGAGGELVRLWEETKNRQTEPEWLNRIRESEERAVEIRAFNPLIVPGLLQTPGYAEVIFRHLSPGEPEDSIASFVKARCERLGQLSADVRAVLPESLLRYTVGSTEVMRGQLHHLLDVAERVRLQVLPTKISYHGELAGAFRILVFEDRVPRVECEHASGSVIDVRPKEVHRLQAVYSELSSWGYDPRQSLVVIEKLLDELDKVDNGQPLVHAKE